MGIYCFTNVINNKKYIGQSTNLEERKKSHYKNQNLSAYNTIFYRALRKYGIDNFEYSILYEKEFLTTEELNELEIAYIEKFDSFHNGYNMNIGGNYTSSQKILTKEDAEKIYQMLISTDKPYKEIGSQYNVSESTIGMINKGKIWILKGYDYPLRKNKTNNQGGRNPNACFSDEEVMSIREEYVTKSLTDIFEEYKYIPFSTLKKIVYGVSFQHLPIYKKRQKSWYLNGTCIDYPRVEEQKCQ